MQAFNINDFQWLEYHPGQVSKAPELTINTDTVVFNSSSLRKLGQPQSVRIMFDPNGKRIALQGMKKRGNDTIDFPPERKSRDFGIHTLEKVKFIRALMPEWKEDSRYKIKGAYHEEENVMVYDLREATLFKGGSFPAAKKQDIE